MMTVNSYLTENFSHYDAILSSALAANTRKAYAQGWQCFENHCRKHNLDPLSAGADDVAKFFIQLATQPSPKSGKVLSIGTVTLYKSSINKAFAEANRRSPANHAKVKTVIQGLTRLRGVSCRRVKALREHHIKRMLNQCADTLIGQRDAALIAIGFAGALRRSEICRLTMDDVEIRNYGNVKRSPKLLLNIRQSKTDQSAKGQTIAIPEGQHIRPIQRLQDWLTASGITQGPVFQTMRRGGTLRGRPMHHSDIPRLVKHYATLANLDPREISAHSLRAGFVTSAAVHRARLDKIMEVTRHTNPATVIKYIRDADLFNDHAGIKFL